MSNDRTVKIRKSGHSTVLTVPSYIKPQADIYDFTREITVKSFIFQNI
ncbi:hypothetical protein LKI01_19790 [Companilactobacillus paralimentarius]|nr:hypothetical protein LKI01_19790 [Companilactobacillus paralimentarius]